MPVPRVAVIYVAVNGIPGTDYPDSAAASGQSAGNQHYQHNHVYAFSVHLLHPVTFVDAVPALQGPARHHRDRK